MSLFNHQNSPQTKNKLNLLLPRFFPSFLFFSISFFLQNKMAGMKKKKPTKIRSDSHVSRNGSRELPEDIMADSGNLMFKEQRPFYRWKRFNFIVGVSVGLLGMYAASTTPAAQSQLSTFQDYLLLQLADIDLAKMLPQSDMVDELLGNFTNFLKPTPATEISFMPAIEYK